VEAAKPDAPVYNKRVTIALTVEMHRRVKRWCVDHSINMADALREGVEKDPRWGVVEAA
jgi:hypothetical protein